MPRARPFAHRRRNRCSQAHEAGRQRISPPELSLDRPSDASCVLPLALNAKDAGMQPRSGRDRQIHDPALQASLHLRRLEPEPAHRRGRQEFPRRRTREGRRRGPRTLRERYHIPGRRRRHHRWPSLGSRCYGRTGAAGARPGQSEFGEPDRVEEPRRHDNPLPAYKELAGRRREIQGKVVVATTVTYPNGHVMQPLSGRRSAATRGLGPIASVGAERRVRLRRVGGP